jgi:hypothetical protein
MRNTCSRRGGEQVEAGLVAEGDRPQVEVDPGEAEPEQRAVGGHDP